LNVCTAISSSNSIEALASSDKRRAHTQRQPAAHNNQRFRTKTHDVLFSFQNFQEFQWYISNVQTPQTSQSKANLKRVKALLRPHPFQRFANNSITAQMCYHLKHFEALLTPETFQSFVNTANISKLC